MLLAGRSAVVGIVTTSAVRPHYSVGPHAWDAHIYGLRNIAIARSASQRLLTIEVQTRDSFQHNGKVQKMLGSSQGCVLHPPLVPM